MAVSILRLESFEEGLCAQVMHIGPYPIEPTTMERMREFMKENRYRDCVCLGIKQHEVYLGDPRKAWVLSESHIVDEISIEKRTVFPPSGFQWNEFSSR